VLTAGAFSIISKSKSSKGTQPNHPNSEKQGTQPNHPNSEKQKIDEMNCSRKSIGDVGVAVAEMACSTKSIGDVGVAVDAHGKPMQAKGDNDAAQSSGKISRNFHI
jgi:hypothetical protein